MYTDQQKDEWKKQHGVIEELRAETPQAPGRAFVMVVRKPARAEISRFQAELGKGEVAVNNLLMSCRLWPEAVEVNGWFEEFPFLLGKFGMELGAMAGSDAEVTKKKL